MREKRRLREFCPFSLRDLAVMLGILAVALLGSMALRSADPEGPSAPLLFVLAVLLISRLTRGYLFGLLASVIGVLCVNWMFTYPYLQLNFKMPGYPLSFLTMLGVSVITCTLTTKNQERDELRVENEKEKMRADLLRAVSHDIRTPLTSIVGSTAAILDNPDTLPEEDKRKLLEDVRDEAQWLIRIVENLLSVTRMNDTGDAELAKEPEAAEEILDEAVRKFRRRFPTPPVTVEAPEELLMVPMDPVLIEQVLANLMENAVLHGKTATDIRVSVERRGGFARFAVADDGQGIPPGLLPVIFSGTLRTEASAAVDGKRNMGLGLSVCRAIVRAHGGAIEAKNLKPHGAEFAFTLPLEEERRHGYSR
jgi:two-component system sensor histidine kinase KdpD